MIRELDTVVLTHDIDQHGLKQGDIGAVVHRYGHGVAFEVEFVTAEGRTIALLTLDPEEATAASKSTSKVDELKGGAYRRKM